MIDPNLLWVLGGTALLGIAASVLGCFAFLRGRSLLGDALAHAALPGVCAAFGLAQALRELGVAGLEPKSLPVLLVGAGVASVFAAWCIAVVTRASRVKEDAAQAIVLSVFFGGGVVALTRLQRTGAGEQAGLDKFIFGQAASLVGSDVQLLALGAFLLCGLSWALWKEWKLLCFDAEFARAIGSRVGVLDGVLLVAIVAAVVLGLQAVGVVLIASLLVTPPAAARFWTDRLGTMVAIAALFGALSGAGGAWASTLLPRLPTGPLIVLAGTILFVVSMLFAPGRGVVSRWWRARATQNTVRRENLLRDLWELQAENGEATVAGLAQKRREGTSVVQRELDGLKRERLAQASGGVWQLSPRGQEEARELVRRHRLWEAFLMYESDLDAAHVHRDADRAEHFLPPETVGALEAFLKKNNIAIE
jgi:manganese/zinc/iron transport system permease protein